jgi:hypothetical protein
MSNRFNALRVNTIVSVIVLILGSVIVLGSLIYSSYKATHRECYYEDMYVDVAGNREIKGVTVMDRHTVTINLGDEVVVVDTCDNRIIKRLKLTLNQLSQTGD